jgi:hypothetical protein
MKPDDIEELVNSGIPLKGSCFGVYFLFNNRELVYIGQGWNCFLRVAEATRTDRIFTSWQFETIADEQELIGKFSPKYNGAAYRPRTSTSK